ncbi:hypothetical protein ACYUMT_04755 [Latilactobacillus sakei]
MKKVWLWISTIVMAIVLVGCGSTMSKKDLKSSYFKIQDSYAKVINDSQKNDTTDKKILSEAKKGKETISTEIDKLKNNSSDEKLTKQLIKFGNLSKEALDSLIFNINGSHDKYKNAPSESGKLSYTLSNQYFDNEYSKEMTKLLDDKAFSNTSSVVEESSSSVPTESTTSEQPSLSNDSIQSTIESADSGIDVESVNGSYADSDSTVQIVLNGRELASNKQAERAMLMDISTIWKTVKDNFDYSKISNIAVSVKYPLKDEGGNTSSEYVIKSDISGNKLDQLNSDGFNYKNVPNFATNWWQSEALPKL